MYSKKKRFRRFDLVSRKIQKNTSELILWNCRLKINSHHDIRRMIRKSQVRVVDNETFAAVPVAVINHPKAIKKNYCVDSINVRCYSLAIMTRREGQKNNIFR